MTCTMTTDSVTGRQIYAPKYERSMKQASEQKMKKSEARSDDQSSQVNSSLGGIKGSVPVNVRSTEKPLSSIKGGKKSPQSPTSPTSTR